MIKVVHIASGDLWAGAEVQLYNLARELNKSDDLQLFVILLNHGMLEHQLLSGGVEVMVVDEQRLSSIHLLIRISKILREIRPNVIHTHRQKENVLGTIASLFVPGAICMRTVHGAPEFHLKPWQVHRHLYTLLDWVCGKYLQRKIVSVSKELAERLFPRFGTSKVCVVENGIDGDAVRQASAETVHLPGPRNNVKIAIIGRLVAVKRLDIFLHAAQLLIQQYPHEHTFYIFGDGPLKQDLEALCKELGIDQHIFLMGFRMNMPAYLSKMNMLFITSDHEGLPMSLLEALCLKIPIVAHAVGGIPRALGGGKCGTLICRQVADEYVEAARKCMHGPNEIRRMVEYGGQLAETRYSAATNAREYRNLYLEIAHR